MIGLRVPTPDLSAEFLSRRRVVDNDVHGPLAGLKRGKGDHGQHPGLGNVERAQAANAVAPDDLDLAVAAEPDAATKALTSADPAGLLPAGDDAVEDTPAERAVGHDFARRFDGQVGEELGSWDDFGCAHGGIIP